MSQVLENQQQALNVLVKAAQVAQKRGAFDLNEASAISQAVNHFLPPPQPQEDPEETSEETSEEDSE